MCFKSLKLTVDSRCVFHEIYEVNLGVSCTQFITIDFTLLWDLIFNEMRHNSRRV